MPDENVGHATRWFVDDAQHAPPTGTFLPGRPSVGGSAVDIANWRISIPRQVLVPPRLTSTSELIQRSVGKFDSHPRPTGTSHPSLSLIVLEPRLDERELVPGEQSKFNWHRHKVSLSRHGM